MRDYRSGCRFERAVLVWLYDELRRAGVDVGFGVSYERELVVRGFVGAVDVLEVYFRGGELFVTPYWVGMVVGSRRFELADPGLVRDVVGFVRGFVQSVPVGKIA